MSFSKILKNKLGRVTSSGKYIAEIDGLRFLAIVPVVLFHVRNHLLVKTAGLYAVSPETEWSARLTSHGYYGVHLFFVISGFVLALPFAAHYLQGKSPVTLKQYYLRRLTRLEPPYIIWLLICFGLFVIARKGSARELSPHLTAGLFYVHSIVYGTHNVLNLVTWSLEIEIQFYLLMPLLAKVFTLRDKVRRRSLITTAIVALIIIQSLFFDGGRLSLSILNFLQFFLVGFLLADVYLLDWNERPTQQLRWDVVSLFGWPAFVLLLGWPDWSHILLPFLIFWLYYSVFRGVYSRRLLTLPIITVIGGMCYTIYLIHFQLISFAGRLFMPIKVSDHFFINYLLTLTVFLPFLIIASICYFFYVEKPCMQRDWPRRLRFKLRALFRNQNKLDKLIVPSSD